MVYAVDPLGTLLFISARKLYIFTVRLKENIKFVLFNSIAIVKYKTISQQQYIAAIIILIDFALIVKCLSISPVQRVSVSTDASRDSQAQFWPTRVIGCSKIQRFY